MEWGICTTVKAPLEQILAFVAWHKHLGAARIWVHLDDADEVSAGVLQQIEGVDAILCDKGYWAEKGFRPKKQEARQTHNMQRVYQLAEVPVLAHVDVDEYLYPARPMAEILGDWTGDLPYLRAVPAEALHDPSLPDDIFTARQFRLPFPNKMPHAERRAVLGAYTDVLPQNMLSHRVGKSLFRTGLAELHPKIHAATIGPENTRPNVPFHPDLTVLHFHAQNKSAWLEALPHRVEKGAYRFNEALAGFMGQASADEIDAFYAVTQTATPELVAALRDKGLLIEAELQLREKVEALP